MSARRLSIMNESRLDRREVVNDLIKAGNRRGTFDFVTAWT